MRKLTGLESLEWKLGNVNSLQTKNISVGSMNRNRIVLYNIFFFLCINNFIISECLQNSQSEK